MEHIIELFSSPAAWLSLLTLTFMEVVLGIDNIVFISIVVGKMERKEQKRARMIGLGLALLFRVALLLCISWIVGLKDPLFTLDLPFTPKDFGVTGKDIILFVGGLFLLAKSTTEIHNKLEGEEEESGPKKVYQSLSKVIVQIVLIDIVFSFDSILTAVGLVDHVTIMIAAVVISMGIMLVFAGVVSDFVNERPTVKMLALSFLILIGVMLMLEAFHLHIPKGYIYFAMAFSLLVEMLNSQLRKRSKPVHLRQNTVIDADEMDLM